MSKTRNEVGAQTLSTPVSSNSSPGHYPVPAVSTTTPGINLFPAELEQSGSAIGLQCVQHAGRLQDIVRLPPVCCVLRCLAYRRRAGSRSATANVLAASLSQPHLSPNLGSDFSPSALPLDPPERGSAQGKRSERADQGGSGGKWGGEGRRDDGKLSTDFSFSDAFRPNGLDQAGMAMSTDSSTSEGKNRQQLLCNAACG